MINLNDIKSRSVKPLLESYKGINPYLIKLSQQVKNTNNLNLTDNQVNYILNNYDKEPTFVNRILKISSYLGEELQKSHHLNFKPERMLVEFILAETDKTYHIYGKLTQKQKHSEMYWVPKTQLLDDPYFEPITIEVDFTKYNEVLSKHGKKLFKHQEEGVKFLLSRNGCILADDMGLGKAWLSDTYILTPKGKIKIKDLKIGDKVIGSNGKPCNVTGVFPQGVKDLYRITFNDGYSGLVCKEHLWTVTSNNSGENSKNRENRYITLSTEQMLDESLVLEQIGTGWNVKRPYKFKTYYKQSNGQNKWQIPIVKPIEFNNSYDLTIEPYLLGLSLGDGYFDDRNNIKISLHKDDFDELFNNLSFIEYKLRDNIRTAYFKLGDELIYLGLDGKKSDTKFIPEIYKYSSIENRLAILQGLMDTDGHCIKSKTGVFLGTEFCTVSEQLADDVAEIVHSLGGIVRKKSKIGKYKKQDGTIVVCKKVYRLNIKLPTEFNPFRLKRKADEYNPPKKYKVGRYISNIKLETTGEAVCISVDSPDKLYVTEHAIVTHNTNTSIVAALESNAKKILIVTTASAKINWEREIKVFDNQTAIVEGKNWKESKFTIINYDILKNFHTLDIKKPKKGEKMDEVIIKRELVNGNFDLIIIDEAHSIKDKDSNRGRIMEELSSSLSDVRIWLLTGTPISNRPMDFFNLLKIIKSKLTENWLFFARRYCDAKKMYRTLKNGNKKQIWVTDGASNLEELGDKTRNLVLRRLKKEVLDMPDKMVIPMYYRMTYAEQTEYNELWDNYVLKRNAIGKSSNVTQKDLIELILLRQFIANITINYTIEMVENAIEMGKKVIVFTTFTEELEKIQEHFGKIAVTHNGKMTAKDKQLSIDEFQQNKKIKVFIGNIQSAGVAITLTEASVVIFNSFSWVPGINEQAEDRSFRIGQKNDVTVYYQLFEDTISNRMWETLSRKKEIISTIIGDKTPISDDEINFIITNSIE
jgi:hypothetical protein